jgi:hypothetical protein
MTKALQCINSWKPYIHAEFEPGILCIVDGLNDHYATSPRPIGLLFTLDCLVKITEVAKNCFAMFFFSHEMLCNDFAKRKNGSDKILCVFFANPSVHPAWEKALPFLLDCVAASPLTHQGLIRLVSEFAEDNNERRTRHEKLRFVVVRPNWMLLTDCPLLPLDSFRRKKCYFC